MNVNDDMDELLRRAAESYPLKTDNTNFDKVLEGLKAENDTEVTFQQRGSRGRVLWLLVLLPLSFICNRYVYPGTNSAPTTQSIKKPVENLSTSKGNLSKNDKGSQPKKQTAASDKSLTAKPSNEKQGNDLVAPGGVTTKSRVRSGSNSGENIAANRNETLAKKIHKASIKVNSEQRLLKRNPLLQSDAVASTKQPVNAMYDDAEKTSGDKNEKTLVEDLAPQQIPGKTTTSDVKEKNEAPLSNEEASMNNNVKKEDKVENSFKPDKTSPDSSTKSKAITKIKRTEKVTSKHFYAGLVLAPDLSAVKSTKVSKVGISVGVLAGYQFNKKLSIETGLLWDKKFYRSEGQFFNTKKLTLPSYVKILDLEGYCNMFELPLGVKYDFVQTKKSNWFTVAGFSSYFMKKESYSYSYMSYGQLHNRTVDYKNSTTNWLSMLNLSVGYTHKLGKNGRLRLEPYIKIPVQGVGIGSLPISSTGLYASFVKEIF